MVTKIIEKLTRENRHTSDDYKLRNLQEEFHFISPIIIPLIGKIIKRKAYLWWKFRKFTTLAFLLLFGVIGYGLHYIYNIPEVKQRIVSKFYTTEIKDSTICIENVINPDLTKYLDYIASTESQNLGNYKAYNEISDAYGRYQFVPIARKCLNNLGVSFTKDFFMKNPEFQDVMMWILLKENDKQLKINGAYDYAGKSINGYYFTKSGLLSLSHAIGSDGSLKFIKSGCNRNSLPTGAPNADRRLTMQKYNIVFKTK